MLCTQTLSHVWVFENPWTVASRLLCPWDSSGMNAGVGCCFLPQGVFQTQALNLSLLHWQADSLPAIEPSGLQSMRSQWEGCTQQVESKPHLPQLEKSPCSNRDPAKPKSNNKQIKRNIQYQYWTSLLLIITNEILLLAGLMVYKWFVIWDCSSK